MATGISGAGITGTAASVYNTSVALPEYVKTAEKMFLPEQNTELIEIYKDLEKVSRKSDSLTEDDGRDTIKLNTFGDHLREKLGSAKVNNEEEFNEIVKNVESKGGIVTFLKNDSKMVTNIFKGKPGCIEIDENASIAAFRHELRHFLDDIENGCPGLAYYLRDRDKFFEYERRGYEEELVIARKFGFYDIEQKILEEIEERRKEIYGDK